MITSNIGPRRVRVRPRRDDDEIRRIAKKLRTLRSCAPQHVSTLELLIDKMLERYGFEPPTIASKKGWRR